MNKYCYLKFTWQNVVMVVFAFACLFSSLLASAQSTESDDTIPKHPFERYNKIICSEVGAKSKAIINFETFSVFYLKIAAEKAFENYQITIRLNKKETRPSKFTDDGILVLDRIPRNSLIEIEYVDGCGNISLLYNNNTEKELLGTSEGLEISHEMMALLKKMYASGEIDIAKYLEKDNSIHYYQKLSFYQNTVLKGSAIPDSQVFGIFPISSSVGDQKVSRCDCRLLVTFPSFSPGEPHYTGAVSVSGSLNGIPVSLGYIGSDNTTISQNWSSNSNEGGGYIHNIYEKGAARHQDTWANGRRIHSRSAEKMVGGDNISPNYAYVGITWFCFNGNTIDACDCRKRVNYTARYDTRLRTSMSLPSCFLCGSKKGKSKAEDWAILALTNEDDFVNVLAAGRGTVETENNSTFNVDFIINYIQILGTLAPVLLAGDNAGTVFIPLIDELVDQVSYLIQTPILLVSGSSAKDKTAALINKQGSFTITPNETWYLKLFSFGNTKVEGQQVGMVRLELPVISLLALQ